MAATDKAKVQRAAQHKDRPGAECKAPAGQFQPIVNIATCEGKADCLAVCPYDVFEIGQVSDDEFRGQNFLTRIKMRIHGRKTARTPRADACRACGLCVVACPERAISLVAVAQGRSV
jgi:NAD-dependent dihydropyrimidine dehydrogenase PreA subunit